MEGKTIMSRGDEELNFRTLDHPRWPTPGSNPFLEVLDSVKTEIDFSDIKYFIECGTGETGDNVLAFSEFFKSITIENNPDLYKEYCHREQTFKEIEFILGDSTGEIKRILGQNKDERFIILLDDHNGYTSFVAEELEAIKNNSNRNDHIIIIDDLKFAGKGTYPTIKKVKELTFQINENYIVKNTHIGQEIYIIYPNIKEEKQ